MNSHIWMVLELIKLFKIRRNKRKEITFPNQVVLKKIKNIKKLGKKKNLKENIIN